MEDYKYITIAIQCYHLSIPAHGGMNQGVKAFPATDPYIELVSHQYIYTAYYLALGSSRVTFGLA